MEEIIKFVGLIAGVFALYKIIIDVVISKSSKEREEYKLSKNFLEDLTNKSIHPYIIEKGFSALTGKKYPVSEISYLLSFSTPSRAIFLRHDSAYFIEFDLKHNCYLWKEKFKKERKRNFISSSYMVYYFIFALLALLPLYYNELKEGLSYITLIIFSVSMAILAFVCLAKHEEFESAKAFLKVQENHMSEHKYITNN